MSENIVFILMLYTKYTFMQLARFGTDMKVLPLNKIWKKKAWAIGRALFLNNFGYNKLYKFCVD